MREDFDYVTIKNYNRDMAESASQAASIIDGLKREKKEVERLLIAAVLSAGGTIEVSIRDQDAAGTGHLLMERDIARDTLILTAAR